MLSTFLTQLQNYFSKYFIIGSFCPMLACTFLNGFLAYFLYGAWHTWADANILPASAVGGTFVTTSIIVAIVLAAYVLASINMFLRRTLEGRWGDWLRSFFISSQMRRREALVARLNEAAMDMADLADSPNWDKKIGDAWKTGHQIHPAVAWQAGAANTAIDNDLTDLETSRSQGGLVSAEVLERAANSIARALETCNMDISPILDKHHRRLVSLVQYADDRARGRYARLRNELNSNFGIQEEAPTRMGNIANTIQGYVMRRYHCNFEIVWSNLQQIVPDGNKTGATLQESKTQLDFLVACCWLTLVSAAFWSIVFAVVDPSRFGFLAASIGGPTLAYMWYRAAAEQYRSFADVAMTSFDTFRLDLLSAMHLQLPADVEDERYIWENFDRLTTFGQARNFSYRYPKQQ
jgi:hypothetical protein